ncbi:hypothetical protein CBL_09068 [Carabus blaptoides fortunei]
MLFLTPRKSNVPVFVPANIVQKLSPVDINSVRHMYNQCFNKGHNCVLNHDKEMNQPRQIHALLAAVKSSKPSLIVCQRTSLSNWCYELSVGLNIILASEITATTKLSNIDVVLVPHDQLKLIKSTSIDEWFLFVVDDIELVIKSRFIKNVDVNFRIAITKHNFLLQQDDELQWDILKWTNPATVESKDLFIQSNKVIKRNLLRPFPDFWHRVSWALFDKIKPTIKSTEEYKMEVEDWCKVHKPKALILSDVKARSTRRSTSKKLKNTVIEPKKRRVTTRKKCIKQENITKNIGVKEADVKNSSKETILSAKINTKRMAFDSSDEDNENTIDTNLVAPNAEAKTSSFMLDEEDPILNSLFMEDNPPSQHFRTKETDSSDTEEYPVEETVAKHTQITVTTADDSCTNMAVDSSTNLILDSLVDSPQPAVGHTEMSSDEDPCAILDLLL